MPCRDSSFGIGVIQLSGIEEEESARLNPNSSKFNCFKISDVVGTRALYIRKVVTHR